MKIMTFNIRGLWGRVKRRVIRSLGITEDVDMLLLQETKTTIVNSFLCESIWGDEGGMEWRMIPALNTAGGILCIWKTSVFNLEETFLGDGFLGLRGKWEDLDCFFVNVYASCLLREKRRL